MYARKQPLLLCVLCGAKHSVKSSTVPVVQQQKRIGDAWPPANTANRRKRRRGSRAAAPCHRKRKTWWERPAETGTAGPATEPVEKIYSKDPGGDRISNLAILCTYDYMSPCVMFLISADLLQWPGNREFLGPGNGIEPIAMAQPPPTCPNNGSASARIKNHCV